MKIESFAQLRYMDVNILAEFVKEEFEAKIEPIKAIKDVPQGYNSKAFAVNDDYIVKIAIEERKIGKLKREIFLLNSLQNRLTLEIPKVVSMWEKDNMTFAIYKKVKGRILTPKDLVEFSEQDKDVVSSQLANFFEEMHNVDFKNLNFDYRYDRFEKKWPSREIILKEIQNEKELTSREKDFICKFCEEYFVKDYKDENLVFGHFDVLLKNFVFDEKENRLKGVFDFGNSGIANSVYDFVCFDFGVDVLDKTLQKYKITPISLREALLHKFYFEVGFYINKLRGAERIMQTEETLIRLRHGMEETNLY